MAQPASEVSKAGYLRHKDFHVMKSQTGSGFNNPSKNGRRERKTGSGFGTNEERLDMLEEALPSNVLHLSPETMNVNHPAPCPIDLPAFFIKAFTDEGDLVYDPFMGSGTTAEAALRLNRKFIGSELNKGYVKVANDRISELLNCLFESQSCEHNGQWLPDPSGKKFCMECGCFLKQADEKITATYL